MMCLPPAQELAGEYFARKGSAVVEIADLDVALLDGFEPGAG